MKHLRTAFISLINVNPGFHTRLTEHERPAGGRIFVDREDDKTPIANKLKPSYKSAECVYKDNS